MEHRIFVCTTCKAEGKAGQLLDAVKARLGPDFTVEGHECFSACADPQAIAFRAPGKAAYVFSGLTVADVEDIAAFSALWVAAKDGWVEDARPSGRLRFCLKARIPAIPIQH